LALGVEECNSEGVEERPLVEDLTLPLDDLDVLLRHALARSAASDLQGIGPREMTVDVVAERELNDYVLERSKR
jgi:hypothetical protein